MQFDDAAGVNVVVIDDDRDEAESLRDILELEQYSVSCHPRLSSFLNHPPEGRVDIVIVDRKLPDGLADDFLPMIRQHVPEADIVFVTGYADLDGTISALRERVSDYLIKPINPEVMLTSLRRIVERQKIERELTAERQFADVILNTAEAIILVLDRNARVVRCNPYLCELTGYAPYEILGSDWIESFIPVRDRDRIRKLFNSCLETSQPGVNVNPIVKKDQTERQIRWSNTALLQSDQTVAGVLSVGLDITDLLEAQNNLLQSQRLATIGETMAGLAHESRNALQRLQNALELLQEDLHDNPSALRDLAKIERASNDLRDLLEEVRSYAAPIHLDCSATSLASAWRRAWIDLESHRRDRDVTLVEGDTDCIVPLDRKKMEQVFRNLFQNALEACEDPVHLTIRCSCDEQTATVVITDNGPGISTKVAGKAFDAFVTSKPTGTGLGLAIVQRIVEAHQGTIKLVPSDKGASFQICLPRNASALDQGPPAP